MRRGGGGVGGGEGPRGTATAMPYKNRDIDEVDEVDEEDEEDGMEIKKRGSGGSGGCGRRSDLCWCWHRLICGAILLMAGVYVVRPLWRNIMEGSYYNDHQPSTPLPPPPIEEKDRPVALYPAPPPRQGQQEEEEEVRYTTTNDMQDG